jgi:hypothetical protein
MNARRHIGIWVIVTVGIGGCGHPKPDPEQERLDRLTRRLVPTLVTKGFSHAFAMNDCGPSDGPAMAIYLLDQHDDAIPPKTAYIRVRLDFEPATFDHESALWERGRGLGIGELCSHGACQAISSGRIDFGEIKAGKSVEGLLDLSFTNDVRVRTKFRGRWVNRPYVCGF